VRFAAPLVLFTVKPDSEMRNRADPRKNRAYRGRSLCCRNTTTRSMFRGRIGRIPCAQTGGGFRRRDRRALRCPVGFVHGKTGFRGAQ
jgi:hypothetical protein